MNDLHLPSWNDIIDFLVLYVIVRGIVAKWLARWITKLFKRLFVHTEQELKLYLIYKERAAKKD